MECLCIEYKIQNEIEWRRVECFLTSHVDCMCTFLFQKHLLLVTELLLYFSSIVKTSKYVPTKVGKIKLTKDNSITLGHCFGMNEPSSSLDFLAKRICGCKLTKYVNLFGYEKKS